MMEQIVIMNYNDDDDDLFIFIRIFKREYLYCTVLIGSNILLC